MQLKDKEGIYHNWVPILGIVFIILYTLLVIFYIFPKIDEMNEKDPTDPVIERCIDSTLTDEGVGVGTMYIYKDGVLFDTAFTIQYPIPEDTVFIYRRKARE